MQRTTFVLFIELKRFIEEQGIEFPIQNVELAKKFSEWLGREIPSRRLVPLMQRLETYHKTRDPLCRVYWHK